MVKNPLAMQESQETKVQSLGQEDPLEEEMVPTPVFLPGESYAQRGLWGCSPWGHKESDRTERLSTHASDIRVGMPRRQWIYEAGTLGIFKS